ncbi:MAG TPA: DUF5777 family beta-barrel protein [Mucilaginibacter sp.]|jgi:hypothetical protein|nr:DUF5777 family beta-barrel protein [Mucilaginibacter sp.]
MKKRNNNSLKINRLARVCLVIVLCAGYSNLMAQDTSKAAPVVKKKSYVKNTFDGNYIIDNQTVMVPIKGTFEFDIQHRFGTVYNGSSDLFGLFASANMRLAASYVPLTDLQVGLAASNEYMQADLNLKYAILKETKDGSMPVSITYYGNVVADTRKKDATTLFVTNSDRLSYFNQIIIARKVTDKFSVQVSPTYSHFNNLEGYLDASGNVLPKMKNDNFSVAVAGRYKISDGSALIVNYDQPLTQNPMDNPRPNISFGIEMKTSGHDFEIFFGNYGSAEPQYNNFFNQNNYRKGQFLLGFNISRLWNF